MSQPCFCPGELLLPGEPVAVEQWACPSAGALSRESWQELEARGENAPGVMRLLVPDALLQRVETGEKLAAAKAAMERAGDTLTRAVQGVVYLERTLPDGRVRRGLVGLVDLEQYDFAQGSRTPVRAPQALAARQVLPRLDRWEDAALQSSHILLAADKSEAELFAPLANIQKEAPLYEGELSYGGGSVKGWAVEDTARLNVLTALFDAEKAPEGAALLAPVSGWEDLAAARAFWMLLREELDQAGREHHPARFCLAEVCSIQSPGLHLAPAHRLVMGVQGLPLLAAFRTWCAGQGVRLEDEPAPESLRPLCFVYGAWQRKVWPTGGRWPLAAAVLEAFLQDYLQENPACFTDRISDETELRELAADGNTGILLSETNEDLFRGLCGGEFLPLGLFASLEARQQRYELECRRIR